MNHETPAQLAARIESANQAASRVAPGSQAVSITGNTITLVGPSGVRIDGWDQYWVRGVFDAFPDTAVEWSSASVAGVFG